MAVVAIVLAVIGVALLPVSLGLAIYWGYLRWQEVQRDQGATPAAGEKG